MKIDINQPCSESWEGMNPCEGGRYCLVCKKTVFDLNEDSKVRFLMRLAANPNDRICIKLQDKIQWKETDIARVFPKLNKRVNAPIAFAAWILLSGLILGCEEDKTSSPSLGKIALTQKVVSKKTMKNENTISKKIKPIRFKETMIDPPPIIVGGYIPEPPPEPLPLGEISIIDTLKESPLTFAETMPTYPGELSDMYKFLYDNMVVPPELMEIGYSGKVFVRFVVEKDGVLTNFEVLKGNEPIANKTAINACKKMPKWNPGFQNGKNVAVYVIIPINIDLR